MNVHMGAGYVVSDAEERSRQVGWVGYQDGVKAQLSVIENAGFYAALYGARMDVRSVLDRVGLTRMADLPAQYLSSGQRRRLGVLLNDRLDVGRQCLPGLCVGDHGGEADLQFSDIAAGHRDVVNLEIRSRKKHGRYHRNQDNPHSAIVRLSPALSVFNCGHPTSAAG